MSPSLTAMKEWLSPIWTVAELQLERCKQWLMPRQQVAFVVAGVVIVLLLLMFSGVTAAVAAVAAWIALLRHFAQTDADRQRRITESYSKAVEQLASDKIEVRLGGIYTLERISRESSQDYWTVMETLCALVRERVYWKAPVEISSETAARSYDDPETAQDLTDLPADVAAVLEVIARRDRKNQQRERGGQWILDFRRTDLRGADLSTTNFSVANFGKANLGGAHLCDADLTRANFRWTDLSGADLSGSNFFEANLSCTNLRGADLHGARFHGANLSESDLWGANLRGANFSGADLRSAIELSGEQLAETKGDAKTRLPDGVLRPAHWHAAEP